MGAFLGAGYFIGRMTKYHTERELVLVQDTDYQAYRVELFDASSRLVQSHVVYSLTEPSVRIGNESLCIGGDWYRLGEAARYCVSSLKVTKLEGNKL